ncbi:MAG: alpha/beta fold hydrolase [Bacteroidales bacterium]|nr:alpha/beta fold hydrolase [Bacteroidales bacterium]
MKRILAFVLLSLALIPARAGKIVTDTLRSDILGADVVYNVYLPDGFSESSDKYPAVYLLHGLYGTYSDWQNTGRMKEVADEFIRSGEIRKMIIVMPNAGHPDVHNEWNGYFNMPGWNYEDFFFQEFIPAVEKEYRAVGDKGHRAIMGLSMGGGGSTVYAQRHPDMFSSCYAMSAWLDQVMDENDPKDKLYYTRKSVREHSALDFVAGADEATIGKLRSIKWFFDCGDDDFLLDLSVALYQKMRSAKIKSELRVRDGVHNWEYWHLALRTALPFASRNFEQ